MAKTLDTLSLLVKRTAYKYDSFLHVSISAPTLLQIICVSNDVCIYLYIVAGLETRPIPLVSISKR